MALSHRHRAQVVFMCYLRCARFLGTAAPSPKATLLPVAGVFENVANLTRVHHGSRRFFPVAYSGNDFLAASFSLVSLD